ncbi:hypothetical protein [Persicitalea sp.]|uniref:hypothetical protein n=1 Tax=Persicitalea sp. TaxID=3100273 RepID=UPI0035942729
MKHSPEYRSRREEERAEQKKTIGYKVWSVVFALMYPFIAVFTFVFSILLKVFSGISQGLAYLLGKVVRK